MGLAERAHKKRYSMDMTKGNIRRQLIAFAVPLLVGNLFQQLYNMVDTWVVGNFVSNEAFSAVGTVGPITNMLIGFFMGLFNGAGVVISRNFGAGDKEKTRQAVSTILIFTIGFGIIFTLVALQLIPVLLKWINMPPEVYPEAKTYLTIYTAGLLTLMVYNMGCAVLQAIGDSLHPFYYLLVSAALNIVLDLLFVIRFKMGVAGVAYATIIAQGVSSVLTLIAVKENPNGLLPSKLVFKPDLFKSILLIGLPSGLQNSIISFSNIFVQSYINAFGTDCMSGWAAYSKIDQLVMLPAQSLALTTMTFVGQNLGNKNEQRAKDGVKEALRLSTEIGVILIVPVVLLAPHLVSFFNNKPEVIHYGTLFLRLITPCYFLSEWNQVYASALRGAGDSRAPMLIMIFAFVVFRQIYLFVMTHYIANAVIPVAMGYPAGWLVCQIIIWYYYRHIGFRKYERAT